MFIKVLVFYFFMTKDYLRGYGKLRGIHIVAENLAEATHKAILACHDYGMRVETPKHVEGKSLGYDEDIMITVLNPLSEPRIYFPGIHDTGVGVMQYILEVTHGIHNHWKKTKKEPHFWGYTYNERFVDQLSFIFQRIKADFDGKGRISGRDYQFTIWRPGEDIILEQEDPPCWQRGHLRFLQDENGESVLNYITDWRSRDLLKAWNENNIGQIELMKLFGLKISDMLGIPINLGSYIDRSSSLHLYGLYIDKDNLEKQIEQMGEQGYETRSMGLDDFYERATGKDSTGLKRLIAAQSDAEARGYGKQQSEERLRNLGYDVDNFPYPNDWDSWPDSWNAEPDVSKLARVVNFEYSTSGIVYPIGCGQEQLLLNWHGVLNS